MLCWIYLTILSELYHFQHHIYFLKCSTLTLMNNIHLNNVIIAFIYNYVMDISTPKLFVHVPNNNLHFQWKIVMGFSVCVSCERWLFILLILVQLLMLSCRSEAVEIQENTLNNFNHFLVRNMCKTIAWLHQFTKMGGLRS